MKLIERIFTKGKTGVWVLVDPDSLALDRLIDNILIAEEGGADVVLVGGSYLKQDCFDDTVRAIKASTKLPVVIFPGNSRQLSKHADGILFTSLLSGRNPQYLIGEQMMAAPIILQMKLEVIPTAYLLIESGGMTSAQFISNSMPLPAGKPDLALAHAQAGMLMGMKAVYLEAGSGAERPVPIAMIQRVAAGTNMKLIVGGGIRSVEDGVAAARAGADAIVIGTIIETLGGGLVKEMVDAINTKN